MARDRLGKICQLSDSNELKLLIDYLPVTSKEGATSDDQRSLKVDLLLEVTGIQTIDIQLPGNCLLSRSLSQHLNAKSVFQRLIQVAFVNVC